MEQERMQVLRMVETGQISADEAAQLLASLDRPAREEEPASAANLGTPVAAGEPALVPENRWARFWIYPLIAGGVVLILGALVIGLAYAAGSVAGSLLCGWPLLLLGLLVVVLALWSRSATWIHVRVKEEGGRRVALSLPVPLNLAAWVLRMAQPYVPQLQDTAADEVIMALRDSANQGQPLSVDVHDDEKGEHVQVYIG